MSLHDFVCHVENNGRCLDGVILLDHPMTTEQEIAEFLANPQTKSDTLEYMIDCLEFEYEGYEDIISRLVLLPKDLTEEQIKAIPLPKLAIYPTRDEKYCSEERDFLDYPGYCQTGLRSGFWSSLWYNFDHWVINFSPLTYDVFVKELYPPEQIPLGWYIRTLYNHGINPKLEPDLEKQRLYQLLRNRIPTLDE